MLALWNYLRPYEDLVFYANKILTCVKYLKRKKFNGQVKTIMTLKSASTDLPIWDISYERNHIICGHLCRVSFT